TYLRDLVRLTLVCKRWRWIVEDSAVLWTKIDATVGRSAVRRALELAGDTLLDITFNEINVETTRGDFFQLVGERIAHWRSFVVVLTLWNWLFALDDIKKEKAPNLERLQLSGADGAGHGGIVVTLFGGQSAPPKLKDVTLANIKINLASLRLGGLRSLTLEQTSGMSSTDIMDIILGSPGIEFLCLSCLESLTGQVPSQQALSLRDSFGNPSIQLTSLLHLSLDHIPMLFLEFLLSSIIAPQLETLEVNCESLRPQAVQPLLASLQHHVPTVTRLLADPRSSQITVTYLACYQFIIGGLNLTLDMDKLSSDSCRETLEWVFNHLGAPVEDLSFHLLLDDWHPDPSHLEWLTRRITVTRLTLYNDPYYNTDLGEIIPLLSRPTTSAPTTWILPQVEVFETNLIWEEGNDGIVEMINDRHSAEDGKDGVAAPVPFREIWLSFGGQGPHNPPSMNMEFLQIVQAVANGADVYWEKEKLP
ncbi:hypothetical protein FRC00_009190, partial [Tulasnella sp. 408]